MNNWPQEAYFKSSLPKLFYEKILACIFPLQLGSWIVINIINSTGSLTKKTFLLMGSNMCYFHEVSEDHNIISIYR